MRPKHLSFFTKASVALLGVVSMLVAPSPVSATSLAWFNPGQLVFDNFSNFDLFPDSDAYWWINEAGVGADGQPTRTREELCSLQSCIELKHEGLNYFLRMGLLQNQNEGVFTLTNLSEEIDGHDELTPDHPEFGLIEPGAWTPAPSKPVIMSYRMRFSDNMLIDGSGGAVGSAGIWLWSNPFSQGAANPFAVYDGFGFNWGQAGTLAAPGLNATLLRSTFPVYTTPISGVNPQDWNLYKVVWRVGSDGNQVIDYYINGNQVGSTPVIGGNMSSMSLEAWIDNQKFVLGPEGTPIILNVNVPENQHFDVDFVKIWKL